MKRLVVLLLFVASCGVDLRVGTLEGGVPATDDGEECAPEVQPSDCTAGGEVCSLDPDCPPGRRCNNETKRCFDSSGPCEGTPCVFDKDCAGEERCNDAMKLCVDMRGSQACRPCTFDDDCGGTKCQPFVRECE